MRLSKTVRKQHAILIGFYRFTGKHRQFETVDQNEPYGWDILLKNYRAVRDAYFTSVLEPSTSSAYQYAHLYRVYCSTAFERVAFR